MTHIVLTGFMAVGKTAVGKRLARRLGRGFIDTDQLIEESVGSAVAEIFDERGEEEFRRIEREIVATLEPPAPTVIATGGGTFVDERNRESLHALGVVVCLVTSIDTVIERAGRNHKRPLARAGRERLEQLFEERLVAYRQADVLVETDGLTVDQSVTRVLSIVEPRLKSDLRGQREPA